MSGIDDLQAALTPKPAGPEPSGIEALTKAVEGAPAPLSAQAGRLAAERDPRMAPPMAEPQRPGETGVDALQRAVTHNPVKPEGAGVVENFGNTMDAHVADLAGAYADKVQGPAIGLAVSAWKAMRGDQKELIAKDHPTEAKVMDFFQGMAEHPVFGSEWLKSRMGEVGLYDKNMPEPQNPAERMAAAAGPATIDAALLGVGAEKFLAEKMAAPALEATGMAKYLASYGITGENIALMLKGAGIRNNLVMGAAGGAAGQAGGETLEAMAPDKLKPAAKIVGELAGGVTGGSVAATAESGFSNFVKSIISHVFSSAETKAAQQAGVTAQNLADIRGHQETVPGSNPTAGQMTGSDSLLGQESRLAGTEKQGPKFAKQEADAREARLDLIRKNADPDASASDVKGFVNDQLTTLKTSVADRAGQAAKDAVDETSALGGAAHAHPDDYAEAIQKRLGELHDEAQGRVDKLLKAVEPDGTVPVSTERLTKDVEKIYDTGNKADKGPTGEEGQLKKVVESFDPTEPFDTLTTLRSRLVDEIRKVRGKGQDTSRLEKMLDSVDETISVHAGNKARTTEGKAKVTEDLSASNRPDPTEVQVGSRGDVVKDPGADTVMAMARQNPDSQIWIHRDPETGQAHAWVSDTKTNGETVEGISKGADTFQVVNNKGGDIYTTNPGRQTPEAVQAKIGKFLNGGAEPAAVKTAAKDLSVLSKEEAIASPILYGVKPWGSTGKVPIFVSRSEAAARAEADRMGVKSTIIPYRPKEGAVIGPSETNATYFEHNGQQSLYTGRASKSGGMVDEAHLESQLGVKKGIRQGVADRFDEADTAANAVRDRYETGPVGQALHPGADEGSFRQRASQVAQNMFDEPAKLKAFVEAAGDDPELLGKLQDFAAFSMRKATMVDGMISPSKLTKWVADHQHVMDQFPQLKTQFESAAKARDTWQQAVTNQREAVAAFQDEAVKKILGDTDVTKAIGSTLKNPDAFGALVDRIKKSGQGTIPGSDEAALAGLKRGVVDHMLAGKDPTGFVTGNRASLEKLFSPEEMANFDKAATSFKEAAAAAASRGSLVGRYVDGATLLAAKFIGHSLVGATVGGAAAHLGAGAYGSMAAAAGGATLSGLAEKFMAGRAAKAEAALADMLLNPKQYAPMFEKVLVTEKNKETVTQMLERRMNTAMANSVIQATHNYGR